MQNTNSRSMAGSSINHCQKYVTQIRDTYRKKKAFKSMTMSSVLKSTVTIKVGMFSVEARRELALFDRSFVTIRRMAQASYVMQVLPFRMVLKMATLELVYFRCVLGHL